MGKSMKYLKYTTKELQSYCNDPGSCVKCVTDTLHIGLPSSGLANFREAVTSTVSQIKVGRFDEKLNGIVLDVRNIKVLANEFPIFNDSAELHIDLRADLYIFEPTVGAVIKGIIKHIASGHISVTVHRVFNVAIRLSGSKKDLKMNTEITIKITKFDLKNTIPFIEGTLDTATNRKTVFQDNDEHGDVQDSGISTEGSRADIKVRNNSDSDSETDDDGVDRKMGFMLDKITIKQEPRSDSDSYSDSEQRESKGETSSSERESKLVLGRVKSERYTTAESESNSSDYEDDMRKNNTPEIPHNVKIEFSSGCSDTDKSVSKKSVRVNKHQQKEERNSDNSATEVIPKKKLNKLKTSRDSLLAKVISEKISVKLEQATEKSLSSKGNKRSRNRDSPSQSIINKKLPVKQEKVMERASPSQESKRPKVDESPPRSISNHNLLVKQEPAPATTSLTKKRKRPEEEKSPSRLVIQKNLSVKQEQTSTKKTKRPKVGESPSRSFTAKTTPTKESKARIADAGPTQSEISKNLSVKQEQATDNVAPTKVKKRRSKGDCNTSLSKISKKKRDKSPEPVSSTMPEVNQTTNPIKTKSPELVKTKKKSSLSNIRETILNKFIAEKSSDSANIPKGTDSTVPTPPSSKMKRRKSFYIESVIAKVMTEKLIDSATADVPSEPPTKKRKTSAAEKRPTLHNNIPAVSSTPPISKIIPSSPSKTTPSKPAKIRKRTMSVDALITKVMANKYATSLQSTPPSILSSAVSATPLPSPKRPSTATMDESIVASAKNNSIADVTSFNSPGLSSTRNDSNAANSLKKSKKKIKNKTEALLNKYLAEV